MQLYRGPRLQMFHLRFSNLRHSAEQTFFKIHSIHYIPSFTYQKYLFSLSYLCYLILISRITTHLLLSGTLIITGSLKGAIILRKYAKIFNMIIAVHCQVQEKSINLSNSN